MTIQETSKDSARSSDARSDEERFMRFAFEFIDSMEVAFWNLPDNRTRCKLISFFQPDSI